MHGCDDCQHVPSQCSLRALATCACTHATCPPDVWTVTQVIDLLARLQHPVQDKAMQGSVLPAAAMSLACLLGDDVSQDRRTLSAAVNALHDMLGHLNPLCQQVRGDTAL